MSAVFERMDVFLEGIRLTLWLTLLAGATSLVAGTLLAAARISPVPALRAASTIYVEVARNTPLTIIFFLAAFGLPRLDVSMSYFNFALLSLTIYYASFFCEAVRSGFNAVSAGQAEAARSIGLGFAGTLRLVILPQAMRSAIPPLINVFIALIKSTAVASAFGVPELLYSMERLANEESQAVLQILGTTAVLYLVITVPTGMLAAYIERRVRFAR